MNRAIVLLPWLWVVARVAFSQETLGDLRMAGAKKLRPEELRSVLVGATATGPGRNNTRTEVTFHPDGKATGYVLAGGRNYAITEGTYRIADDGNLCVHYEYYGGIPPYDACIPIFVNAGQYFLSYSDTDPQAQVVPRIFKK